MAEQDRDTATGRFEPKYPNDAFLEAVQEHEPAATIEVAEAVGIARRNAHYRLEKLADAGQVTKKKVGNSLVWSPGVENTV
jgi:predicted transcriptional regulator